MSAQASLCYPRSTASFGDEIAMGHLKYPCPTCQHRRLALKGPQKMQRSSNCYRTQNLAKMDRTKRVGARYTHSTLASRTLLLEETPLGWARLIATDYLVS